ncbi:MAG: glycosyltransferase family 39 protein [Cyanobacteriota bacterium]|nr:glycosyltransferase family 39 protein [Cyanobacteriota bacterium]
MTRPRVGFGARWRSFGWWACLAALWALATALDRTWLALDRRLPSWDQADYLNSAVDHGRALGLLPPETGGNWLALLDLSPKIPPLASLVNGTVMAIAGQTPDQASWALSVWQALLLLVVALWGRQLVGRSFGLLCGTLLLLAPALVHLRVDFTLDLPLAASATLALWLLGRWQAPDPEGGRWEQLLAAVLAMAAALLVKQSALLLLAGPTLWAAGDGLRRPRRRFQVLLGVMVVLAPLLPWLQHNWITTLGGTNRAVLESAAAEGDPAVLSWASWSWYLRGLPGQLGPVLLLPLLALGGGRAAEALARRRGGAPQGANRSAVPHGWAWLVGCAFSGWLLTTLSPNKDPRYFTAVLPLLVILLARVWWEVGLGIQRRWGQPRAWALLLAGVAAATSHAIAVAAAQIQRRAPAPVAEATERLRGLVGDQPTTLLVVPGHPELNEQTVTTFGRLSGGRIEGRRLGRARREHPLVLARSSWILLATGDQGTDRPLSRELSHRVRADGRFQRLASWPWSDGRQVELWQRRPGVTAKTFDADFIRLARGMERGPEGLGPVFARIGAEHQLDAHFLYQDRVRAWALARLQQRPDDADALWSLALVATLRNRPLEAQQWYSTLERLHPSNPWPLAYRSVVLLASWNPNGAHLALRQAPVAVQRDPVIQALEDLTGVLSGRLNRVSPLRGSLPRAVAEVKERLETGRMQVKQ